MYVEKVKQKTKDADHEKQHNYVIEVEKEW
jgi:hypothetical protein